MKPDCVELRCGTYLAVLLALGGSVAASAQDTPEMREIISRLEHLEKDNQALTDEIRALRQELKSLRPPALQGASSNDSTEPLRRAEAQEPAAEDREAIQQSRIEELEQTKVEASQKFPVRITGMALFNAYLNGPYNNNAANPTVASFLPGQATGGGTFRQSTLGLLFNGPGTFLDGKVSGSIYMDFFAGSSASLGHLFRLRTATSLLVGQDKPLISPRDPDSLAQVGISPLTSAGNLWLWQPQVRIEQRFSLGQDAGVRAQFGVFQTAYLDLATGPSAYNPSPLGKPAEHSLPGAEGRVELWRRWGDTERIEVAGGFHLSRNRVNSVEVPTEIYSLDWFLRPAPKLEFSGAYFSGQNVSPLGALQPGYTFLEYGEVIPVHSKGGWSQLRLPLTPRLSFSLYGGLEADRSSDLLYDSISKNRAYFGNVMYRLAPNVLVSFEAGQVRTTYLGDSNRLNNHYDLALAYLF
jgi:hypothetical protein